MHQTHGITHSQDQHPHYPWTIQDKCLQISASNFNLTISLRCISDYPRRHGCHTEVLRNCDHSAVISSCSTYTLGTDGSDCFCCSIHINICILHLHLKHETCALQKFCLCDSLHDVTYLCVLRNALASYIHTFTTSVSSIPGLSISL